MERKLEKKLAKNIMKISDFKCSWHGEQKPVLCCPKCWELITHKKIKPMQKDVIPMQKCCDKCSKSKYALKGKNKKFFGGICGLTCECHSK